MAKKNKTFIIAEAGVNHNGKLDLAYKLINKAAEANVDAIKFQTFTAGNLVIKSASLAKYQKKNIKINNQYKLLKKLEFTKKMHVKCIERCKAKKIKFLSSPFSISDIKYLKSLKQNIFKIPSGEITNYPYLEYIGSLNKKIILSTGMSNSKEISNAINILLNNGTKKRNITLLHCNSAYPTPFSDVNLNSITFLRKKFSLNVGISDHSPGIEVPICSVAYGVTVIEKHFTLDKKMKGPDHTSSIDYKELKQMVISIRNIENSLGKTQKTISKSEKENIKIVRKSIVASKNISKGQIFLHDNITCKRPGFGISPIHYNKILGKKAYKNFKKDDLIVLK